METRQRRNLPKVMDNSGAIAEPSAPPARLSAPLRKFWVDLWESPAAQLMDPVGDLPAVTRLFEMYALGKQLANQIDDPEPGDRISELITARARISAEARALETQLGLSPRSRQALGQSLFAGRKKAGSLADAAEAANEDD